MFQKNDSVYHYYLSYFYLFLILTNIFLLLLWNNTIFLLVFLFFLCILFIMTIGYNQIRQYFRDFHAEKPFKLIF